MIGPGRIDAHGQLRLSEPTNTTCTEADVYYKLAGTLTDGCCSGFSTADNKITWLGPTGTKFLFNGVSDLQVDKACDITYTLFKNGAEVDGASTPHSFLSPSKTGNISIVRIISLTQGDVLEAYVKSSEALTTINTQTFSITFWR